MFINTPVIVLMQHFIIKLFCVLLLSLGSLESLYSRYIPLHFNQLTIDDGLSINNIEFVSEDSLGFIWFGSQYGLNRFDGYEVRKYFADQSKFSLPNSIITSLFCDSNGRLWVGTQEGIARYDASIDGFINYDFKAKNPQDINARMVVHISEDNYGRIWFVTEKGFFYSQSSTRDTFINNPIYILEKPLSVKTFYFNDTDKQTLWIGTNQGLIKYDLELMTYRLYQLVDPDKVNLLSLNIRCILPDGNDLWLGIYRIGIIRFNKTTGEYKLYKQTSDIQNYIINGHRDRNGNLWFATGSGLFLYDRDNDAFQRYARGTGYPHSLSTSGITSIYQDSNGIYWIGTNYEGVNYSWGRINFLSYQVDPDNRRNLPERRVNDFYVNDDGSMWVVHQTGIDVYNRSSMQLIRYYHNDVNDPFSLGGPSIWRTVKDQDGRLWVTSYSGGLQRFYQNHNRFISYKNIDEPDGKTIGFDIRDISIDRNGCLWLATHGIGFSKFDPVSVRFQNFKIDSENQTFNWSYSILADHRERVWVGTTSGLFVHNLHGERLAAFFFDDENSESLLHNQVNVLFLDSQNRIWVGTSNGINLYVEETGGFKRFETNNKLTGKYICSIKEDSNNNLWISTRGNGLFTFNPNDWLNTGLATVLQYDRADGLQSNEFSERSSYRDENGYLYFGGVNGFTVFHPDSINTNTSPPNVLINEIKLFDELIYPKPNSPVKYLDEGRKILTLKHHQNVLTIGFTAINFQQPQKNNYQYKLEGFDDRWYTAGVSREAVYTNLPAGNYFFRVIASNNDGVWNQIGASVEIVVLPPWWQTAWFRFLTVFSFVGLMYAFFLWRVQSMKRQKRYLELMVKKKTSQLEMQNKDIVEMSEKIHQADQFKIRFFMNVSHEFRTPLTLIIAPLANLMHNYKASDPIHKQLSFIHRNANRLLRLVNQLLDIQKMDMKKYSLSVTKVAISDLILSVFQVFEYTARERNILFHLHIDRYFNNFQMWTDGDAIEKILFNLLSNAFKHTPQNGTVELILEHSDNPNKMVFVVSDTGTGIEEGDLEKIFERYFTKSGHNDSNPGIGIGLTLVRELVVLLNGQIAVESKLGKGTKFIVEIPINSEAPSQLEQIGTDSTEVKNLPYLSIGDSEKAADNSEPKEHRILVVEDDPDLLSYLLFDLKSEFNVEGVKNGRLAVESMPTFLPDLIISDVMMPEMNGIELCEQIKNDEEFGHIPIILLTAKTDDQSILSGYQTGADDYIAKPFNTKLLKARIFNLIESRKKLRSRFDQYADMKEKIPVDGTDDRFLAKAIAFVEKNISNPAIGHKELATELGISKTTLYVKISQLTGYSINIFIRTVRLKRAASLLKAGGLTVAEVAYQVGFNDPNYFSRCFKDHFHLSPSEYAQKS